MNFIADELAQLESQGLRRHLRQVSSPQNREIILNGQRVLNFCSNNYLGLADDDRLTGAVIEGAKRFGLGSGASRLVCGNVTTHGQLETDLAQLMKTESCLVYSSGYMANVGVISALMGRGDIVFSDKLNHASIIDGIILSRATLKRYPHVDMKALVDGLKQAGKFRRRLIVTDAVFSMDGDVAPLDEIVALARQYKAMVMVDEAHSFGVLGRRGTGLVEHLGLEADVDIHMGTLSKAAGCFGAYVCGTNNLREFLINHSRAFIYTTAMPALLAEAARVAIGIIGKDTGRRQQLLQNADDIRAFINSQGFDTMNSTTPIIPIVFKDSQRALEASQGLLAQGIFAQAIRPPTVQVNTARLRVTVMATHTRDDLDRFKLGFKKMLAMLT